MKQQPLSWIEEAKKHIGLSEIVGKQHNPTIINWLIQLNAWWRDDETPWCGTFVAHCLKETNRKLPKHWYRAKAYVHYGTPLKQPAYGCIVVFERQGGGHVGFVVGRDKEGHLMVLGGNQGNQVSIAKFPRNRVIAYVWPCLGKGNYPHRNRYKLPYFGDDVGFSGSQE